MAAIRQLPHAVGDYFAVPSDGYVNAVSLAVSTAESISVPAGARFVLFSATADFYAAYGGTTATVPGDTTDGTASELNPTMRRLLSGAISVISASTCVVTATFYS